MANVTIGPKIKEFRKKNNLTQQQLAQSLGYSGKSVISHIEKGDADMTYDKIALLLKVYNLDANELFDLPAEAKKAIKPKEEQVEAPSKKIAVYIHGFHGSAKEAKDYSFLKDEYDVVGLDYPNGTPWELKEPIQNEFKRLTKGYDEVVVIANSIGAFYTTEYLSKYKIKKAFFISPIVSMLQIIIDKMMENNIKDKTLEKKKIIKLDDGTVLSYDFYQHVSNDEDNWKIPTEILYGSFDQMVYFGNIQEFLENHPLAKLTVKSESEHHFHTKEEKAFVKKWIMRNI